MILIKKFVINRDEILKPFVFNSVVRFIIKNIPYDDYIAKLADGLNVNSRSRAKERLRACIMIKECLPYYYEEIIESVNNSPLIIKRMARLVKVSNDNLYKVVEETDIVNFIQVLINDNENNGIKLKLGGYVVLNENGRIVKIFNSLPCGYSPTLEKSNIDAFRQKKSQLKFLSLLQISDRPIYTIVEKSDNHIGDYALAYLFTVYEYNGNIRVVLESLAYNRATYLFQIRTDKFEHSINIIKQYFSSVKPNKRSCFLDANNIFSHENGFTLYSKLIHDNEGNWWSRLIRVALGVMP